MVREVARSPQLQDRVDEVREAFAIVQRVIEEGQSSGAFRRDIDARLASWIFYGGLEEVLTGWVLGQLPDSEDDVARAERTAIEIALRGLAARLARVKIFNLNGDEWDRVEERPGWRSKDAWVGAHIDAELIGGSMYELEPGDRLWPYHTHHANEEWLIVLRGAPDAAYAGRRARAARGRRRLLPRAVRRARHQVRNDDRRADPRADAVDADRAGHRRVPRHRQGRRAKRRGERILLAPRSRPRLLGRRGLSSRDPSAALRCSLMPAKRLTSPSRSLDRTTLWSNDLVN